MTKLYTKLKCEKCYREGKDTVSFGNIRGVWLCTEHWNKILRKIQEYERKVILEE